MPDPTIDDVEIVHVGNIKIRSISEPAPDLDKARIIADVLLQKLDQLRGAGLAAPQIGIMHRIFVIHIKKTDLFPDREETPAYVMINPEMEVPPCGQIEDWEGCFSVPGYAGKVPRHDIVNLKWTDYDGNAREQKFEGYLARVVQHEYDHLEGRVYLDHMSDMLLFSTTENYLKMRREGTLP